MSRRPPSNPASALRDATDLVVVLAVVAATVVVVLLGAPTAVRLPLALFTALLAPGYAVTAALFPAVASTPDPRENDPSDRGITLMERAVLSIGISLGSVVIVGFGLDRVVGTVSSGTLLGGIAVVTVGSAATAAWRRSRVPPSVRYAPTLGRRGSGASSTRRYRPTVLTLAVVLCVVLSGAAVAYSQSDARQSPSLTELYFQPNAVNGGPESPAYPTNVTRGTSTRFPAVVENHEGAPVTYTVVAQLQRVERRGNGTEVLDRRRIATTGLQVPPDGRRVIETTATPNRTGSYRMVYLLYRGEAPRNPRIDNSYREVHLWIDVRA